jgi:hypothetical protein
MHKTMYILDKIALAVQPKMQQDLRGIDPARFSAINHIAFDPRVATILQIRKRAIRPLAIVAGS